MYWADKVANEVIKSGEYRPYWVDDMKTPSGFAHVGSLMGPVVHSLIYRALKDRKVEVTYTFVINDFDPVDGLSADLMKDYLKYLGFPLKNTPSPDKNFKSMADYYSNDFMTAFKSLGVEAKILSSWEMYHEGKFDEVIRIALDNSEKIQDIYHKVSGSKKKEKGWLPFQVICENCGKIGTTRVYTWDGGKVFYKCEANLVEWAIGCGHEGKISPFGGTGKLPWKVDWAAHWKVIGVTIEGAGKDHASAGGSYDIAMTICKEVFNYPQPYKLPYEFILIGGRKMSSSKGLGLKAHDLTSIVPPEIGRFLFARADIKRQSNFDPEGSLAIPDLFDEYDRSWKAYVENSNEDLSRTFMLSQIKEVPEKDDIFLPRLRDVANYIQQPSLDIISEFEKVKKDKLTKKEKDILEERKKYAKIWLERYAPEEEVIKLIKELPEQAKNLSADQKKFLKKVVSLLGKESKPEQLEVELYKAAKEIGVSAKDAFLAIYLSLLGRTSGPKAAWLLLQYPKGEVLKRLNDVVNIGVKEGLEKDEVSTISLPEYFQIDETLKKAYPTISIGIALIKGVKIKKTDSRLEKEKKEFLESLERLSTEEIGRYPEIASYRKLYKEIGVDWHSKRPSPEALLRRVVLKKGLYNVNTCVDAYNLVVMQKRVTVGTFDADKIKFPTVLRFAKESDEILLLGDEKPTKYTSKELAYYDQEGGYNIDFNYRDAQRTMVTEETRNLWINVDGVYGITPEQVQKTLDESIEKIIRYCGGKLEFKGVVT